MVPLLQARAIHKEYRRGLIPVKALDGVDLEVQAGEFLAIMGPSGSGKSTLLHVLGALDEPTSGEIHFQGKRMAAWGKEPGATAFRRRHLGFVFQSFNLVRSMTARENVGLPLILEGARPEEIMSATETWLRRVGLWERRNHRPYELSGGEQQRIAVARALVHKPAIVLADEPTGNLDTANGRQVLDLLERMCREEGTAVVLVTHDIFAAARADRILMLRDGQITAEWRFGPNTGRQARIQMIMERLHVLEVW